MPPRKYRFVKGCLWVFRNGALVHSLAKFQRTSFLVSKDAAPVLFWEFKCRRCELTMKIYFKTGQLVIVGKASPFQLMCWECSCPFIFVISCKIISCKPLGRERAPNTDTLIFFFLKLLLSWQNVFLLVSIWVPLWIIYFSLFLNQKAGLRLLVVNGNLTVYLNKNVFFFAF